MSKRTNKLRRKLKSLQIGFKCLNTLVWQQQIDIDDLREVVAEHELQNLAADRVVNVEEDKPVLDLA